MKHAILAAAALAVLVSAAPAQAADISGAGSTFIYPLVAKWAAIYKQRTGIGLNYQSIGSGGGIKQIEARTVTFGATDKPLEDDELEHNGLIQFPVVMGGIVPIFHLEGIGPGGIVLDGEILAGIYLGHITNWDDPAIVALNPGVKLPSEGIVVVHRSDGSGTTFNFTDYLAKRSPEWADQIGIDTAIEWPVGLGAKGSEGVAATVQQTSGSIGYVEYAYAVENDLSHARMRNAAGRTVAPSLESFAAAAANADWAGASNFNLIITDQPGEQTWPIAASTWVLIHARPRDPAAAATALAFFDWAYREGDAAAADLDYVAIPDNVVALITKAWAGVTSGGKPVFTSGS